MNSNETGVFQPYVSTEFLINSMNSGFPINKSLPESKMPENYEMSSDRCVGEDIENLKYLETFKLSAHPTIDQRYLHMSGGNMIIAPEPPRFLEDKNCIPTYSHFLKKKIANQSDFTEIGKTSDTSDTRIYQMMANRIKRKPLDDNVRQSQDPSSKVRQFKQETFGLFRDLNRSSNFTHNEMETDNHE